VRYQLLARTGHPDFLDLPWDRPLADWDHQRIVEVPRGIHRHVVRTVEYPEGLYVLKELPNRYAQREYRFLRYLAEENVPVVDVVGVVHDRRTLAGDPLEAVLITKHLEYSLPYRLLFARREARTLREPMLDALVDLLVRLHLVGFLWGDCSLSNTLFRRDAGSLAAYVVDTETGELHDNGLTDGQRAYDIETAIERCGGELLDLQAQGVLSADVDAAELGDELRSRYRALWEELTREDVFTSEERYRIHDRLRRINELGYDVEELEIVGDDDESRLRLRTRVVEPGRHRRWLRELTGLDVQENQARRLLNDLSNFHAWLEQSEGRQFSDQQVARRWLDQSFQPTVDVVPDDLRGRRDPAELFHEILDHWYFLSTCEGYDMELVDAARSYVDNVLRFEPEERTISTEDAAPLDPDGGNIH
jgi:hypothetical protein